MKPSLEQLKVQRDTYQREAERYFTMSKDSSCRRDAIDAQIAAEEEREAKAKEWPQEGDQMWWLDSQGVMFESTFAAGWKSHALAMGLLFRTRADAELVRDFLRSRPRGWLLAMAKLRNMPAYVNDVGALVVAWHRDQLAALTDDERAALLGHG